MAKKAKSTPPHLPKGMEVNVPLHDVMQILKMIAARDQARAFQSAAKKRAC